MAVVQDLWRMLARLRPERTSYLGGLLALSLVNISDVLAPVFMAVAIDLAEAALSGHTPKTPTLLQLFGLRSADFTIWSSVGLYLVLQASANFFRYPMIMWIAVPSHRIGQRLRNELVDHLLRLSRPFYDRSRSGDLMSRATADIHATRMFYGPGIIVGVDTLMLAALVVVVLLGLSWKLTLIALIPLPLIVLITNKLSHAEYKRFEVLQADLANMTERVRESYAGISILQGYAREDYDRARFEQYSWRHLQKNLRLARVRSVFEPSLDLMLGVSTVLVLIFGGIQVSKGTLTVGTFVAFLFLVRYLAGPMIGFGWAISLFQRGRASMGRLQALLQEPIEIKDKPTASEAGDSGDLTVRDLTFSYRGQRHPDTGEIEESEAPLPPVLQQIDLHLPAGKTLGILGPVGSGKSTLANLLVRLYDPPPGTIFLGGEDIRDLTLDSLRRNVVLAPQDTFLFSDTVARNMSLARPEEQAQRPESLARLAHLHEEIITMPEGYGSLLGEKGVNLSGGQRQRLAIARAIGADPKILILDDCLSAVDARTEEAILSNLQQIFEQRSGIIISHRVIAVQRCDEIIVLEEGKISERGTHEQLLALDGYYASIARQQMKGLSL